MSVSEKNLSSLDEIDQFEQALQLFLDGHADVDRFTATCLQLGASKYLVDAWCPGNW